MTTVESGDKGNFREKSKLPPVQIVPPAKNGLIGRQRGAANPADLCRTRFISQERQIFTTCVKQPGGPSSTCSQSTNRQLKHSVLDESIPFESTYSPVGIDFNRSAPLCVLGWIQDDCFFNCSTTPVNKMQRVGRAIKIDPHR